MRKILFLVFAALTFAAPSSHAGNTITCPPTLAFAIPSGWIQLMSGPARFQRAAVENNTLRCHYTFHGPSTPVRDVIFDISPPTPSGQTCTATRNGFTCR